MRALSPPTWGPDVGLPIKVRVLLPGFQTVGIVLAGRDTIPASSMIPWTGAACAHGPAQPIR